MPSPKYMIGVKGDECQCGRRATIRHCTSCGSVRIYARRERHHKCLDGSYKFVEVEFRCQACGHLFIDEERQFCEAPAYGPILAAQKVRALADAKKQGEYLRPEDKRLADALEAATSVAQQPQQTEAVYDDTALKNIWFALKRAWADLAFESRMKKVACPSVSDFVEQHLPETNLPQQYIDKILEWQRAEATNG